MTAPLCLGIDADPIGRDGSGNETYLRGIIAASQALLTGDERLVLAGRDPDALRAVAEGNTTVVGLRAGPLGDLELGRVLTRAGANVALGHYIAPPGFGGPIVTVVHDVAYRRVPDTFPRLLRWRLRVVIPWSLRRSRLIATVSEFSKREIVDAYPSTDPKRVIVTPNAAAARFSAPRSPADLAAAAERYQLPDSFVLAAGNRQPRKNIGRLVEATAALGVPLVIAGRWRWGAEEESPPPHVRLLGYVPDDDLVSLYRLCTLFAYPSLYEGFGIPILEAMAAGAPVVTSRVAAMPEVAGDAAVLVDPTSVDDIAAGLRRVLDDQGLRDTLRAGGSAQAARFTWPASAATLLAACRELHAGTP